MKMIGKKKQSSPEAPGQTPMDRQNQTYYNFISEWASFIVNLLTVLDKQGGTGQLGILIRNDTKQVIEIGNDQIKRCELVL